MRSCDVLVYDRLVAPELVEEAPADALRIRRHGLLQRQVNELLVSLGRERDVVRLKGGDPFVFGRGGEEALALAEAGVPFQVVSGVSALAAVPAAAGIPVTHRHLASQLTVVSGHDEHALDYAALAGAPGTLLLFMALGRLAHIADRLIAHGRAPTTPTAVIASGTLPEQQVVTTTLASIAEAASDLDSPVLVVVGDVVALGPRLCPRVLQSALPGRA